MILLPQLYKNEKTGTVGLSHYASSSALQVQGFYIYRGVFV